MTFITVRPGKLTRKEIFKICEDSEVLENVLRHNGMPKSHSFWQRTMENNYWSILKPEILAKWGKPNCTVTGYESCPGVWLLDDSKTGIIWMIWTDLHHKHAWKGTSYEIVCPGLIGDDELLEAMQRLVPMLTEV